MKRMLLVWVMMLCLAPLGAWAEDEVFPKLHPVCPSHRRKPSGEAVP